MWIAHAAFLEDALHLWTEGPDPAAGEAPPPAPRPRRGRGPKKPPAAAQPLGRDGGLEGIAAALAAGGVDLTTVYAAPRQLTAWLPTIGEHPLASNGLLEAEPPPAGETSLRPWTVTALPLAPGVAADFLCACAGQEVLEAGVLVGPDLAFWTLALRFTGALAARERFLPGVSGEGKAWCARWQPAPLAEDRERLAALAAAMPPAARALGADPAALPEGTAAGLLARFVARALDHLVRSSVLSPRPSPARKRTPLPSLHDQWLAALVAPDPALTGTADELAALARAVGEWHRPLDAVSASPLRLCFRLEEPPEEDGAAPWQVRYLLQPLDDPSLLLPAGEVWSAKGKKKALLARGGADPRHYLLGALGQAAGLCPAIEQSLRSPAPEGYALDGDGARDFLVETAGALEQAGFGVLLPAWWTGRGSRVRLGVRAQVKSPKLSAGGGLTLDALVEFRWQAALGGETMTLAELQELAALKSPLVRVRGQWVEVDGAELKAALALWKKKGAERMTVRDVLRLSLGQGDGPGALPVEGVEAAGWVGDLLARLTGDGAFAELAPPVALRAELRPYQCRGYSWLGFLRQWGLGACLADDMGLGKTIQALALVLRDWTATAPEERRPVLLVCPTSVVGNWQKEAERFAPDLPVLVHHGVSRAKGEAFRAEAGRHALVLSSYALLHRDAAVLAGVPWAGVILDEAQNIKNPETQQARAARGLPADYRLALTGTPVENNVGDLWSLMEFLNPGLLGTRAEFRRRFFLPIQAGRDPEAAARLKRLTGPFVLRRLKTDRSIIADLPEKLEMKVFCTLTREQASLYAAVVDEAGRALEEAEGIQRKGIVLATLMKLKQVCNHPAQFLGDNSAIPGRSGKLARLTEMLEEIAAVGEKALVFTQFAEMGELLRRHLQESFGREVPFLHGGVAKVARDRMVERFQEDGGDGHGPRVFLLSLKAGGTGLNLTAANHVFHFDRWWNPAVENQATDRAFRIGQTRNVQVHKFLCAGTLEEKIDELIEAKRAVAEEVVGTGEGWLTELSTRELQELFRLRRDAVGE
ncbi:MAG: DEAD/DEAH box helicase [Deferrisomatales bacterium]|nr:DEAD/DEAH box helicase [Deferrisomatales bacterium]